MPMIISIISIVVLAALAWAVKEMFSLKLCPICAGVSLTWLGLLLLRYTGNVVDTVALGILMGGSVVGMAYTVDKKIENARLAMIWKLLFIPAGFGAVYALIYFWSVVSALLIVYLGLITVWFTRHSHKQFSAPKDEQRKKIEDELTKCC